MVAPSLTKLGIKILWDACNEIQWPLPLHLKASHSNFGIKLGFSAGIYQWWNVEHLGSILPSLLAVSLDKGWMRAAVQVMRLLAELFHAWVILGIKLLFLKYLHNLITIILSFSKLHMSALHIVGHCFPLWIGFLLWDLPGYFGAKSVFFEMIGYPVDLWPLTYFFGLDS